MKKQQGLDDTTLTAEAKYPINFKQSNRKFVLSLLYNGSDLCLGNISRDFTINTVNKNRIKRKCKSFFCSL